MPHPARAKATARIHSLVMWRAPVERRQSRRRGEGGPVASYRPVESAGTEPALLGFGRRRPRADAIKPAGQCGPLSQQRLTHLKPILDEAIEQDVGKRISLAA